MRKVSLSISCRFQSDSKYRSEVSDALGQLPCSNARGNQHDSCLEGTREIILKEIMDWANDCSARPIFGLVDQAGTGKSTISIHMAQKWEKEDALIGRFFFSIPNSVTNANDLPTTLARDMANSGSSLRSFILEAINDHRMVCVYAIEAKEGWFHQRTGSSAKEHGGESLHSRTGKHTPRNIRKLGYKTLRGVLQASTGTSAE
jgi:hypothetical protein